MIARSFARIHESNPEAGLLALTFRDLDDYERIREDDRISLPALWCWRWASWVMCRVRRADGAAGRDADPAALLHDSAGAVV